MDLTRQLQEAFREELEEIRESLESAARRLSDLDGPVPDGDFEAIFRGVHTLKGAARAADRQPVESACHAFESWLDARRREAVEPNAQDMERELRTFLARLRDLVGNKQARAPLMGADPSRPATEPSTASIRVPREKIETLRAAMATLNQVTAEQRSGTPEVDEVANRLRALRDAVRAEIGDSSGQRPLRDRLLREMREMEFQLRRARQSMTATAARNSEAVSEVFAAKRALRVQRLDSIKAQLAAEALRTADVAGKRVDFTFDAGEIEVHQSVAEHLRDALLHAVRNAVDHGIEAAAERRRQGKAEAGTVAVLAEYSERDLVVRVLDDGRGIDIDSARAAMARRGIDESSMSDGEIMDALFEFGFSTLEETTTSSGRGVGLDVVRASVRALRGEVSFVPAEVGTALQIRCPLENTDVTGVVVQVSGRSYLLPERTVLRALKIRDGDLHSVEGRAYFHLDSEHVPVVHLDEILGNPRGSKVTTVGVLLHASGRKLVVGVDQLVGFGRFPVQSWGPRVRSSPLATGAVLMDRAEIAIVLDMRALLLRARAGAFHAADETAKRRRVLIVDDSVTTRLLLQTVLSARGYQTILARNGRDAVELLLDSPPDVVVTDIEMPVMDGFELLQWIRRHRDLAHLPVVVVTALASEQSRRLAVEHGADAYLEKTTFGQHQLIATLQDLLA